MTKFIRPQVFMIAETQVNDDAMNNMLNAVGAKGWYQKHELERSGDDGFSHAESLIEIAGRMCYKSFGTELNANLTKVREGNEQYIGNVLNVGHGSILEHASVTFGIIGTSRVITHELVRHRAGTAFSQESMRFVRVDQIRFYYPESFGETPEVEKLVTEQLESISHVYRRLTNILLADPDMPFSEKKKITSALRRLLPDGICTDIIVTANHRAWRHMIEMRTSPHAEEEIRVVFKDIAEALADANPNLYQDMYITIDGAGFEFKNSKV